MVKVSMLHGYSKRLCFWDKFFGAKFYNMKQLEAKIFEAKIDLLLLQVLA